MGTVDGAADKYTALVLGMKCQLAGDAGAVVVEVVEVVVELNVYMVSSVVVEKVKQVEVEVVVQARLEVEWLVVVGGTVTSQQAQPVVVWLDAEKHEDLHLNVVPQHMVKQMAPLRCEWDPGDRNGISDDQAVAGADAPRRHGDVASERSWLVGTPVEHWKEAQDFREEEILEQ
eukprot:s611_g7.t1